jgi:SCY1-like protein 2
MTWKKVLNRTLPFISDIYKLMLSDNKKYGLSVNLMATRVMPSLLPQTVNPRLHLEQFSTLLEVLQEMLDHIDRYKHCWSLNKQLSKKTPCHVLTVLMWNYLRRNQRNKLKLDHLAPSHGSHGQTPKDYSYSKINSKGLRHQRSSDNMNIGPFGSPMFVPNVHIENAATVNSGPTLPCQRKTSSAEDMMMRKNSTAGNLCLFLAYALSYFVDHFFPVGKKSVL